MRLSYLAYTFSLAMMYYSFVLLIPVLVAVIFNEMNAISAAAKNAFAKISTINNSNLDIIISFNLEIITSIF